MLPLASSQLDFSGGTPNTYTKIPFGVHARNSNNIIQSIKDHQLGVLIVIKMQIGKLMLVVSFIMSAHKGPIYYLDKTGEGPALVQEAAIKQDQLLSEEFKAMKEHQESEASFIESKRIKFIDLSSVQNDLMDQNPSEKGTISTR